MRTVKIIIPNEKPMSWNHLASRKHWSSRHYEVNRVKGMVRVYLDPDLPMFDKPVNIKVTVYFENEKIWLDPSNITAKLYEDGLIGWLIKDDNPKYVRSMTTVSLLDRDNPRVEIELSEAE